ncbi:MAG: NAD(P)/FAD-dependent oxidoreductase, partial [Myxococcales bacterium]|nr:NAD(P)/FAD-dependent oxidoreductase [Myxococcales bacterium]
MSAAVTPRESGAAGVVDREDRVLVVGAGFTGLGAAAALVRNGVPHDQVEADDDVGGNWYHGVYDSVHIISSRKTTELPDWPMPPDWPDFPSAAQMLAYLRGYADHAGLRPRLELRTRAADIRPAPDRPGRWLVTITGPAGEPETRLYRAVVVANGHHWNRRFPDYPGLRDRFAGELIHSKDYRRAADLAGKRVLVIGGGNS